MLHITLLKWKIKHSSMLHINCLDLNTLLKLKARNENHTLLWLCDNKIVFKLVENPMLNVVAHRITKPFQSWKNLR